MTPRRSETLAIAFAAALALHAAILALAALLGQGPPDTPERLVTVVLAAPDEPSPTPPPLDVPDPPAPSAPEPEPIRLGIEQGSDAAKAWLGLDESTPHAARLSPVDQSALDPSPGSGARAAPAPTPAPPSPPANVHPAPPAEPAPELATNASSAPPAPRSARHATLPPPPEVPFETAHPVRAPTTPTPIATPLPVMALPERVTSDLNLPEPSRVVPTPPAPARHAEHRLPPPPLPAPTPPSPPGSPAPGSPALQADAQSDATSRDGAIDVRPGKVLAAKGLRIRTVRPRYTAATLLTARPRDASVRVEFDSLGQVRDARFLPGRDTGYPDVDRALIESIYQWSAAGEGLSRLASPDDRAAFTFRLLLR